jgi:integrase/recombinase XerD
MTPIAPHITAYLRQRLPHEREASRHTVDTYSYAFKLLFEFASERLGVAPSALTVEQLDAPLLLDFLEHLQTDRGNSGRTRNARLVAIKSFMRFLEHRVPSALDQIRRVLAIPVQRTDVPLVRHVNADECQAILDAPDPTTRLGIRDRAILYMGFAGGLRVSEIVGLRVDDVAFDGRYVEVHVRGKGRKHRALALWQEVAEALRAWIAVRGDAPALELFLNWRGEPMTRWGCGHVLKKHVAAAASVCPSVAKRRVSPHVLRHTCAMSVLQATGDIRRVALWLGHSSQRTSEVYLPADPTEKLAALDAVQLPSIRPGTFEPPDRLLAMLSGKDPATGGQAAPSGRRSSATSRSPAPDK